MTDSTELAWRGWTAAGPENQAAVTSGRLDTRAVQHRIFPKTRSWFALGAPLELLSPLAVLRVLFALAAVVWPLAALATGIPHSATATILATTALCGGLWWLLVRRPVVSRRLCEVLVAVLTVGTAAVVHQSGQRLSLVVIYLAINPAVVVFAGLFLSGAGLKRYHLVAFVAIWLALLPRAGTVNAGIAALAVQLVAVALALTTQLLCQAARHQNTTDPDTGLPNGFGLARRIKTLELDSYVVAALHLAGLAEAREALGYPAGTELLRRAVENVGQVLPEGLVGRLENDEVVVVVALDAESGGGHLEALALAETLGARLASAISGAIYMVGGVEILLQTHVGAALAPWDGDDVVELLRRASLTARHALRQGSTYRVHADEEGALTSDDLQMLSMLGHAGSRGELHLAFHPQVDPATSRIVRVEALVRWDSPDFGAVSPGAFIPLAERTGLITRLTDWVLAEALAAAARWVSAGHRVAVSVNLSAADLTRTDLAQWVLKELATHVVDPHLLTLEITETAATVDLFQSIELLAPVRLQGTRVAIDDFGTGYTSLAVLPRLALDELKIDQRFVTDCLASAADDAVVRSINDLGHRLGLDVVAEGVESAECAAHLAELGIDLLQGYAYTRPLSEAQLLALLESSSTLTPTAALAEQAPPDGA